MVKPKKMKVLELETLDLCGLIMRNIDQSPEQEARLMDRLEAPESLQADEEQVIDQDKVDLLSVSSGKLPQESRGQSCELNRSSTNPKKHSDLTRAEPSKKDDPNDHSSADPEHSEHFQKKIVEHFSDSESQSEVPREIPESFKEILSAVVSGQSAFDAAYQNYVPDESDELVFKAFIFHFFCKDNKNASRKRFSDVLKHDYAVCLREIKDLELLKGAYMKRGSSVRISAFTLLLRKLNLPPIRDGENVVIKTDKLTHRFLHAFVRKDPKFLEQIKAEIANEKELEAYFRSRFEHYFKKRIEPMLAQLRRAIQKAAEPRWQVTVPVRMILTPIDFEAALKSLSRLTL